MWHLRVKAVCEKYMTWWRHQEKSFGTSAQSQLTQNNQMPPRSTLAQLQCCTCMERNEHARCTCDVTTVGHKNVSESYWNPMRRMAVIMREKGTTTSQLQVTVCDREARINTAWSRLKDGSITLSRWTWQWAETGFCGALYNTCFKRGLSVIPSITLTLSYSKRWSWLRYQVHNGVVSLLRCKCTAVIDKADESAGEVFGSPEPKVRSRIVTELPAQIPGISGGKSGQSEWEKCSPRAATTTKILGALQFTPKCSKCEFMYLDESKQCF